MHALTQTHIHPLMMRAVGCVCVCVSDSPYRLYYWVITSRRGTRDRCEPLLTAIVLRQNTQYRDICTTLWRCMRASVIGWDQWRRQKVTIIYIYYKTAVSIEIVLFDFFFLLFIESRPTTSMIRLPGVDIFSTAKILQNTRIVVQ
jgi:hypothetical protein